MVFMNIAARRGPSPLWAGFDGKVLAGSMTLLQVAQQLLPEDHTDVVEVKVQQKMDSASSRYKGEPSLPRIAADRQCLLQVPRWKSIWTVCMQWGSTT